MKKLYLYIVTLFLFFNTHALAKQQIVLPEDFEGEYTRTQVENLQKDNPTQLNYDQITNIILEIGAYFHNKYPQDAFYEEGFIENLRPFFPNDSDTQLMEKLYFLRNAIAIYDKGKELYNKFLQKYLTPHTYRKVHKYSDYDHDDEVPYMEAKPGHFIKVYNFKKFLTYSQNKDEVRAIADFENAHKKEKDIMDHIKDITEKLEWKKLFLYGTVYKNPLLSETGLSPVQSSQNVSVRIISRDIYIDGKTEMDFGLHINTRPFSFILANNISPDHLKPQFDFSNSENIKEVSVSYPTPIYTNTFPFAHKYFGDFLIPLKVKVENTNKPVILRVNLTLNSCDNNMDCVAEHFDLQQKIEPLGEEIFSNGFDNFFVQSINNLPNTEESELELRKFVIDQNDNRQIIRLEFNAKENIGSFKIFLEEKNGYTKFSAPLISLHDNKIYVRMEPMFADKNPDLRDQEFIITAVLNDNSAYQETVKLQAASMFDTDTPKLNLGLLILAILGGFILNFMPCVFPVLSLKIAAFSRNRRAQALKRNLWATVGGIFAGFTVLTLLLLAAKYLGYSLGWGMQFQNMTFLVIMTFILATFIIILPQMNFSALLKYVGNSNRSNFLLGTLIVLLATPCTGPYLATAIGFALSGTYLDIICIMYAVATGLSAPYLLVLCLKQPENIFPKPGAWMNKLQIVANITLYLTVIWFISLILGQTSWSYIATFIVILSVFLFIFNIYLKFQDYLQGIFEEEISKYIPRIQRGSYIFILVIFIICNAVCTYLAHRSYNANYEKNMLNRQTLVDEDLIHKYLEKGHSVLVEIGADWCMTCHVNNLLLFNKINMQKWKEVYNLEFIRVDWTNNEPKTLDYMARYGRKGLPFYILYTPFIREGLVLPEVFYIQEFEQILNDAIIK